MSDPGNDRKKKSSKSAAKNPALDWIIRGVVFGVLGVLLVLALLDFRAKQSATGTAEAWRAALKAKEENAELKKSEFDAVPIKGSPALTSGKAEANAVAAVSVNTYTWNGTFRSYTVKVYFGLGADAPIEQIEGP